MFKAQLAYAPAGFDCFLCDFGCFFVAEMRVYGRYYSYARFDVILHECDVRLYILQAQIIERTECVHHYTDGLQQIEHKHRFHDVKLELPGFRRKAYRVVVADNLKRNLINKLGHDGVDLAGHYRRTGLS